MQFCWIIIFHLRNYNNLTSNRRNLFFFISIIYLLLRIFLYEKKTTFEFTIKSFFFLHFRHCNDIWTTHHSQTIRGPLNISDDEATIESHSAREFNLRIAFLFQSRVVHFAVQHAETKFVLINLFEMVRKKLVS